MIEKELTELKDRADAAYLACNLFETWHPENIGGITRRRQEFAEANIAYREARESLA